MEFRAQVPWFIRAGRLDLFKPFRYDRTTLDDTERAVNDQIINAMSTIVDGARQGLYEERTLYTLFILTSLQDIHGSILTISRHYGARYVSLAPNDLVVFGGLLHKDGKPLAWRIAELTGLYGGVGNGPQASFLDVFADFHDLHGIWDCRTGERLGDAMALGQFMYHAVQRAIPEGIVPDFDAMRRCG